MEEALAASAAHGVEIYNHSCVIECDRGSGIAIADFLLNEGKRIVFTATDDSHFRIDDAAGGWVMVAAEDNTPDALLNALKAGQHYATLDPEIPSVALVGDQLEVRCSPASAIIVAGSGYMSTSVQGRNMTHGVWTYQDMTAATSASRFLMPTAARRGPTPTGVIDPAACINIY